MDSNPLEDDHIEIDSLFPLPPIETTAEFNWDYDKTEEEDHPKTSE